MIRDHAFVRDGAGLTTGEGQAAWQHSLLGYIPGGGQKCRKENGDASVFLGGERSIEMGSGWDPAGEKWRG
jgi:hypothetical protein